MHVLLFLLFLFLLFYRRFLNTLLLASALFVFLLLLDLLFRCLLLWFILFRLVRVALIALVLTFLLLPVFVLHSVIVARAGLVASFLLIQLLFFDVAALFATFGCSLGFLDGFHFTLLSLFLLFYLLLHRSTDLVRVRVCFIG